MRHVPRHCKESDLSMLPDMNARRARSGRMVAVGNMKCFPLLSFGRALLKKVSENFRKGAIYLAALP